MRRKLISLGLMLVLTTLAPAVEQDPTIGRSYRIPYRLTNTNHYLVRVRINGKGPFNFLVDSGAPAMYVGTEAAKAIGLKSTDEDFWTPIDRLELEGGAVLTKLKARVEDPFQLTGMNALGLPGASIDGILGFTILARFKMEFDPTKDRMTWTRIDYQPRDPFVPRLVRGKKAEAPPPEIQAMQMLGPMMKFAAVLVGKQPEDELHPRGFLGIEVKEESGKLRVLAVLADSPAAKAGVQKDDQIVRILDREVDDLKAAYAAIARVYAGAELPLVVRRGNENLNLTLTAGEGF